MLNAYNVLKTVHILAVITWVGGTVTTVLLAMRLLRTRDRVRMFRFVGDVAWLGKFVLTPASVTVFVFGLSTAIVGHYSFRSVWLWLGITGLALTILNDVLRLEPELKRILQTGDEKGVVDPAIERRARTVVAVSRVDLAIMLLVIIDMVVKPGS